MALPILGALAGAGGLASSIGSLFGQNDYSPKTDIGSSAVGTMMGYRQTLPMALALNQIYQPSYLGLGTSNLSRLLLGAPEETQTSYAPAWFYGDHLPTSAPKWQNTLTGEISDIKPAGGQAGNWQKVYARGQTVPAQGGLLDLLGQVSPRLTELGTQSSTAAREANLAALERFMPQYRAAYESANPEMARLFQSADMGVKLGSRWNPEDLNRVTGSVRGDWAGRGLGASMPAASAEMMAILGGGEGLRSSRMNQAQSIYGMTPNYASLILGEQGTLPSSMNFLTGQQPLTYQGNQYNPYNSAATSGALGAGQLGQNAGQYQSSTLNDWGRDLLAAAGVLWPER
jgi:hypothetical protein